MKNSDQKPFDRVLKDRLAEGTAPVPGFVWDRVEEELFPRKKRRPFFWWFFNGFSILLIGLFLSLAFSGAKAHSQHTSLAKNTVSKSKDQSAATNEIAQQNTRKTTQNTPETTVGLQAHGQAGKSSVSGNSGVTHPHRKSSQSSGKIHLKTHSESSPGSLANHSKGSGSGKATRKSLIVKGEKENLISLRNGKQALRDLTINKTESVVPAVSESQNEGSKTEQKKNDPASDSKPTNETVVTKDLSYAEVVALIDRDFPRTPDEQAKPERTSVFSLGIYGGPSLYNAAVFKDYFTSGQLSKRTFASSGFELGLQARFKLGNRFRVDAGFAFNQKQTQFSYNVAITQDDYFTYLANGEAVPLANIRDDGSNSCFLAKDVTVNYQMRSVLISLGTSFEFLRIGKFSAAADLRLSGNLYSSLQLKQVRVLSIEQPASETFSYLQPGAGLSLSYRLNERISLGLAPFFSKQFYLKESATRKLEELVIPVTVSFDF